MTPGVSFHLDGADKLATKTEVVKTAIDNILFLKQHFTDMQFISVENTEHAQNKYVIDPEVIIQVVRETKISFLFDISHANWSAQERGETLREYIDQLPMDDVYEVHINGWIKKNGRQMAHLKIQEELYDLVRDIIAYYPIRIITLEYGRPNDWIGAGIPTVNMESSNPAAKIEVAEQLQRLTELISD